MKCFYCIYYCHFWIPANLVITTPFSSSKCFPLKALVQINLGIWSKSFIWSEFSEGSKMVLMMVIPVLAMILLSSYSSGMVIWKSDLKALTNSRMYLPWLTTNTKGGVSVLKLSSLKTLTRSLWKRQSENDFLSISNNIPTLKLVQILLQWTYNFNTNFGANQFH